jgi:hypothetical protein
MHKPTSSDPRHIGDVVEDGLAMLDGPSRLEAFYRLPLPMQRGAWRALCVEIEHEREGERAA